MRLCEKCITYQVSYFVKLVIKFKKDVENCKNLNAQIQQLFIFCIEEGYL